MKLRQREDEIFDEYRSRGERIIPDGAISVDYETVRPRLLIVLKEANDSTGKWAESGGDIRGFGYWGGRYATWANLARWSALVSNTLIRFDEIDVSTRELRAIHLRRIAVVNLKKTPGGPTANPAVIEEFAISYRDLLDKQFKLYKPDLTLAAGTFEILTRLRGKRESITPKQGNCFPHCRDEDLGICLDFYHPQQRKLTNRCLFEYLTRQLVCHGFGT